ncbi:MAG: ornithine carbamoyltransferase [Methanobacterium sp.]|uniref:ornithine carbamoyltransferase n=1 Tax=Methanobacterium sp. TaxID=2164 RepID=UPI003D662065|nr:ornithine carbamoyltransferase [Methanobacterium sp.]
MKHLLSMEDAKDHVHEILVLAGKFKRGEIPGEPLAKKTLAMIFEKASTRTRISFEVGMYQLGGTALYLSKDDLQLGRGEIVEDTAKAMSRYVDGVMIRAIEHEDVLKFSQNSNAPVINGLTNLEHPCQAFADLLTIYERKKSFDMKLAFVGDGNNVCNSLLLASAFVGMDMNVVCPPGYEPDVEIFKKAKKYAKKTGAELKIINDIEKGVQGVDVVYTDVWISMGDEEEASKRINDFSDYQVNKNLMKHADNDAMILHCLPAIRGQEITADMINSPKSSIWDQAENRLHAQKAVLYLLIS